MIGTPLAVVVADPMTDPRWLALQSSNDAKLFHSAPWLRTLQQTYAIEPKALLALDADSDVRGGLLYSDLDGLLGSRIVSLPFTDACDPLLRDRGAWTALFDHLKEAGRPISLRCLDDTIASADTLLAVTKRARWHTLPVTGEEDALFGRLDGSRRRAIRKARQGGVEVKPLEGANGVSAFHRMHVRVRKNKYRLLAQPLAFFDSMRQQFEAVDGWFPLGAFVGPQVVAATIFLRWGDTLYYKFNTSRTDALALRPNDLLVWEGIRLAKSLGCTKLDLGPSDDDQPGLIRFKRQFGADERELRFLSYKPPHSTNASAQTYRRLLGRATRVLTSPHVPDYITRQAGALLYGFFA